MIPAIVGVDIDDALTLESLRLPKRLAWAQNGSW